MQVLEGLSDDLAVAVLRQGGDLELLLHSLPPSLHPDAIHAAFPALKSHITLSIDCAEHSLKASTAALNTFTALSAAPGPKKLLLSNLDAVLSTNTSKREWKMFQLALKQAIVSRPSHVSVACLPGLNLYPERRKRVSRFIQSGLWTNTDVHGLDLQLESGLAELRTICPIVASHLGSLPGLQDLSLDMFSDSEGYPRSTVSMFTNAVKRLTHLTRLRLMSDIGPESLGQCVAPLAHLRSLTLNMRHPRPMFFDSAIESLGAALACLTNLTTLRFHQTCTHHREYFGVGGPEPVVLHPHTTSGFSV